MGNVHCGFFTGLVNSVYSWFANPRSPSGKQSTPRFVSRDYCPWNCLIARWKLSCAV
jgi:hypothetical protein